MDPLSISASIIAVVTLTSKIAEYLSDVKDASKDRKRFVLEISNVSNLLKNLIYHIEESSAQNEWLMAVKDLATSGGPIDQYKSALEQLDSKLPSAASSGLKKIGSAFTWTFNKEDISTILAGIERLKSLTQIALEIDHL